MLSGEQAELLSAALREAFTVDELRQLLFYRLDKKLADLTLAENYQMLAFDIIATADREGWLSDLVKAVGQARPGNRTLASIRDGLSMSQEQGAADFRQPVGPGRPGLGELLFQAQVPKPAGQFAVGFGPHNTLVVVGQDAAVHYWSLAGGVRAAGLAPGERLRDGIHVAIATLEPSVAFARPRRLSVTQLRSGGVANGAEVALEKDEFIVRGGGEGFATHNGRRVAVRDFRNGAVRWEHPCPAALATSVIDATGTVVATADGRVGRRGNKVTVGCRERPRLYELTLDNVPLVGPGCVLGLSPGGELLAAASLHEVVLARPQAGELLFRHPLRGFREAFPVLGTRPQRLIPLPDGAVLWLRGRRVVVIRSGSDELYYLPQEGDIHDIAFDYPASRVAMVSGAGLASVWRWVPF